MDKNGAIFINNWQAGIGDSPYTGFADVRNCEIHYPAGVLKIAQAPATLLTGGGSNPVTGLPTWITEDYNSNTFYAGGYIHGNIYQFTVNAAIAALSLSGTSIAFGTGGGLFYKGYLIATAMASGTGSLTLVGMKSSQFYTLGTLDSATVGDVTPFYWAQNDTVYIGIQKYVDSFFAGDSFDPSSGGTYTTPLLKALDVYNYYKIDTISEIGVNLYFGASKRATDITAESYEGKIFPWNTTDPSFKLPIILDKGGVYQMISRNGQVTFANGHKGNFITTNGSLTQDLPDIGLIKNNKPNIFFTMFPEAKDFVNGEYLFGISTSDTTSTPAGIYGFKDGAWRFLEIATGSTGATNTLSIGVIKKKDDTNFYVGWQDNNTYGIDEFGANHYCYTGYRARVDTMLYSVGSAINPHQFNKVDITLGKPLAIGQGIRLSYRGNLSDSFTLMGTYDYATYGATDGIQDGAQLPAMNNVQFRIELTTPANSTTTPELVSVRISTNN